MAASKNPRKRGATSGAALGAAERKEQAVALRKKGKSYAQIGDALGISKQAAHGLVVGALKEHREQTAEEVADLRAIENLRLDELLATWFPLALAGDKDAAAIVLKIQDRRAKLEGLDAATKTELTGKDGSALQVQSTVDLTLLDDTKLAQLEALLQAATPKAD